MLFIVVIGGAIAISPISLAMLWPLPVVCLASFGLGITMEIMMVQWTVALARKISPERLARVSSYDALGTVMAMPVGALAPARLGHRSVGHPVRGRGADSGGDRPRAHPARRARHAVRLRLAAGRAVAGGQSPAGQWPGDLPELDDDLVGGAARR